MVAADNAVKLSIINDPMYALMIEIDTGSEEHCLKTLKDALKYLGSQLLTNNFPIFSCSESLKKINTNALIAKFHIIKYCPAELQKLPA